MANSGSVLALAARLRGLDDDALTRLVTARGVRAHGIRDVFDLAEALLDRVSVQAALERLDRGTLALLATAGRLSTTGSAPTAAELAADLGADAHEVARRTSVAVDAGLLAAESGRYAPWDAVVEQLDAWPAFGLPTAPDLVGAPPPAALEPVTDADLRFVDRGASDRAFATLAAVAELLHALAAEPARRLSRGGTALPDARRLAVATGADPDDVELLLDIAARAGLVDTGAEWSPAAASATWLGASRLERWSALAREAEQLGITGGGTPSTPGAALLLDGPEAATAAMRGLLPDEVDKVYLQPDLSIIAPGPLVTSLDERLRRFAEVETQGLASSYRVTADSVTRALTGGDTVAGIRDVLAGISLTGIPQPLEYLLTDTAARFGALRVGALDGPEEFGAYVRADDTALLDRLAVDPNLAALALSRSGDHRIVTRFDLAMLYWSLADARYPVVAEDAAGEIVALRRERRAAAGGTVTDDTAAILVQRVRTGTTGEAEETGQAWNARQLELAIRNKLAVTVVVRMPDGAETPYLLEPAAVAGGRLRARDRRSDIERTLPLSHIVSVQPGD